jgi:hypothetical protein
MEVVCRDGLTLNPISARMGQIGAGKEPGRLQAARSRTRARRGGGFIGRPMQNNGSGLFVPGYVKGRELDVIWFQALFPVDLVFRYN